MSQATLTARAATSRRRSTKGDSGASWGSPATYLVATVLIAVCIAPVLYIIIGGFRSNSQITVSPSGWPDPWVLTNYTSVLQSGLFWQQFGNSMISGIATTAATVALALMASFVIARYHFAGRNAMYALFAAGLMFPITVAITPLYLLVKNLGLTNSLAGIILPQIAFALPVAVIILVPFMAAIPKELEEAAAIDGASRLGFLPHGAAALAAGSDHHRHPHVRHRVEQLPVAPVHPERLQELHPAAGCSGVRLRAFGRHCCRPRVHLPFDDPALVFFSIFERRIVGGLTGAVKG